MRALVSSVLLICSSACDTPVSHPWVAGLGTTTSGEIFVAFDQTWKGGDQDYYARHSYVLVQADGEQVPTRSIPPLLALNCSDQPATLGNCVPFSWVWSDAKKYRIANFSLPGGDHIDIHRVTPDTGTISRTSYDGLSRWTRDNVSVPGDAIRGTSLLIATSSGWGVENLNINTGEAIWSIQAPDRL